jgi:hypothetical protein
MNPWPPPEPAAPPPVSTDERAPENRTLPAMADLAALAAELDEIDAALARMDAGSL